MATKQKLEKKGHKDLEKLQQYQMKLQVLDQQMRQVQENLGHLNRQRTELTVIEHSLEELKGIEIGKEILIPVSSGIFAKAELKNNSKLLVNVGGNTTVERTVDETKNMISSQKEEITKLEQDMQNQLKQLAEEALGIESEIVNSQNV